MKNTEDKLVGTIPIFEDLFPNHKAVSEDSIKEILTGLYLRDCVFILSRLSRQYYQYCRSTTVTGGCNEYNNICFDYCDKEMMQAIKNHALQGRIYSRIFPELSIMYLLKLCLKYCDEKDYTPPNKDFSQNTVHDLGRCLLMTNSLLHAAQISGTDNSKNCFKLLVNFTKQLIVDSNFDIYQKIYQTFFLYNKFFKKYLQYFDLEKVFRDKYGVTIIEYLAFLFSIYSKFFVSEDSSKASEVPGLGSGTAFRNLKPKYQEKLLNNLIINYSDYRNIDSSFFNITPLIKRPFIEFPDGTIIPLNLRCLFLGITGSLYFDIFDYLPENQQKLFSTYFGYVIEDYFLDIILHIDPDAISSQGYDKNSKKTPDAIILGEDAMLFFECKKRQFHTLEFLQYGTKEMYLERLNEFFYTPLEQLCNRIKDFRSGKFIVKGIDRLDTKIYPIVVSPATPPIFSGGWDIHELDKYILPEYYKRDKNLEPPEFMDFDELECIEEYLRKNPNKSFIDLIKIKREDEKFHNANWMTILLKNNMHLRNKRLRRQYFKEVKNFKNLLFLDNKK